MVETIYGCKWSLTVYRLLPNGINRPGEMVRSVEGLTTKVLNECLRKNVTFGIIERIAYNEIPPRVEYVVPPFGRNFIRILDALEQLQEEIATEARRTWRGAEFDTTVRPCPAFLPAPSPAGIRIGRLSNMVVRDQLRGYSAGRRGCRE